MTKDIERKAFEALPLAKLALDQDWVRYHKESNTYYPSKDFCPDSAPEAMSFAWQAWQAAIARMEVRINTLDEMLLNQGEALAQAKAQAVPEESKHEGGYYLQDCRGYIGNCMKFWYTHGYGAKLHNFHRFPTLDDALKAAGGAPWHKPWYAPYVDSLAEKTIDMQLADREQEKAMIEAQENS